MGTPELKTVAGLRDETHFEGTTAKELTQAFRESIGNYLELRSEPEQHRKAALRAAVEDISLSRSIFHPIESAPSRSPLASPPEMKMVAGFSSLLAPLHPAVVTS